MQAEEQSQKSHPRHAGAQAFRSAKENYGCEKPQRLDQQHPFAKSKAEAHDSLRHVERGRSWLDVKAHRQSDGQQYKQQMVETDQHKGMEMAEG